MASLWWVYMIETVSGKLYTGISTDIDRRFLEHCSVTTRAEAMEQTAKSKKTKGAKFFRSDSPRAVVYKQLFANRSEASQRESAIKKMPRTSKLALVAEYKAGPAGGF